MASPLHCLAGLTIVAVGAAQTAQAQTVAKTRATTDSAVRVAVEFITASDFRTKLGALAHDSTRGRETPSVELERATEWVGRQFEQAGLLPGGDSDGFLQRFQIRRRRLDSLTTVSITRNGQTTAWALGQDILYAVGGLPAEVRTVPVVLLTGIPTDTAHPFGDVPVRGTVLLHVVPLEQLTGRVLNPLHQRANAAGVLAHIVASVIPDEMWAQFARGSFPERWDVVGAAPRPTDLRMAVFGLRLDALSELLPTVATDQAALPPRAGAQIRPLPDVTLSITPHYSGVQQAVVANVIGVIEGSDPALRDEAVVFTSHLDHVGAIPGRCRPSQAIPRDSICNGADDNASGTVGVIELAKAFATLHPRPARTLVFAAMTAEERGLFGSRFYVGHPFVPLAQTVAVINLDMIARNPPDTVGFVGKDFSSLGQVVDRLAREHSDLRLVAAEHEGRFAASDHYPFAERGVPALFFFSGEHADLHTAADNPERVDPDQASRIVRLAFFVGLAVAEAAERPTWDAAARARLVSP